MSPPRDFGIVFVVFVIRLTSKIQSKGKHSQHPTITEMASLLLASRFDGVWCGRSCKSIATCVISKAANAQNSLAYVWASVMVVTAVVYVKISLVLTGVGRVVVALRVPALIVDGARVV